jgi:hypothetical protein
MNPYLYCKPNDITEAQAKNFEQKVLDLAPQHVRIFYLQRWFNGTEDPISKGDPRTADSFIRTCRLAQKAGATINVTNWYGPWVDVPRQMNEFADTLHRLIIDEKITAIRYITVQNEPNLHEDKIKKDLYANLYRNLDAALRKKGLRDKLQIVSGDLVQDNQEQWFAMLGNDLSKISDGYSIHAYWDYWDTPKITRRLRLPREIVDALPPAQQRPLFITEFGVRGHRPEQKVEPGTHEDGTPIADKPLQANLLAQFMLQSLNRGYVGGCIWTVEDAWYDRLMPYGLIGAAKDGWPLKPGYQMVKLLTHTTRPGWRAVKIEGESDGKILAATRGPKGELSIYALNCTESPTNASVSGLPAGASFHVTRWNADGRGTLSKLPDVTIAPTAAINLQLAPMEMLALSTE